MKTIELSDAATTAQDLVRQAAKGPVLLHDATGRSFILAEVVKPTQKSWHSAIIPNCSRSSNGLGPAPPVKAG